MTEFDGWPSQRVLQVRLLLGIIFSCLLTMVALVDVYWFHHLTAPEDAFLVEHPVEDSANTVRLREMEWRIKQQLPYLACEQRPSNDAPFAITRKGNVCVRDSLEVQLTIQHPPADEHASGLLLNISLPLPMSQLLQLRAAALPSQLSVGHIDQMNRQLRSSLDLPASRIQFSESFHQALLRIKDDVVEQFIRLAVTADTQRDLGSWMLRLAFHKLILYSVGDFFVRHRDAYKLEGQLATLIVLLPTAAKAAGASERAALVGGVVKVRRPPATGLNWWSHAVVSKIKETEVVWDAARLPKEAAGIGADSEAHTCWQDTTSVPLHYLVFWSDCEHEVTRVERGYRVVLMFHVILERDTYR